MNKLKVIELFGGICATSKALVDLEIEHESIYVDFEKKVVDMKNKLWGTDDIPIDINDFSYGKVDLVVAGFPCQPFSLAGKGNGFNDPRGKLFKDAIRVVRESNPDNVIFENVKGILQKKHIWIVNQIEYELKQLGYNVSRQLLNAKHWVPQNRERVFIIGSKTKDVINDIKPDKERTDALFHYLDDKVDDGYHIKDINLENIVDKGGNFFYFKLSDGTTRKLGYREKENNYLLPISKRYDQNIVCDKTGDCNTITSAGLNKLLKNRTKIDGLFHKTFNQENYLNGYKALQIGTITATGASSKQKILESLEPLRIRYITQFEAMRLMGWDNKNILKLKDEPKTKVYFVAGNSMVVDVMKSILKELYMKG